MPIRIPDRLPARETLIKEGVMVMDESVAVRQDIRPLRIGLLNLMPNKIATETQIARLVGSTPLQVELSLIRIGSHKSRNTSDEHLISFYRTFEEVRHGHDETQDRNGESRQRRKKSSDQPEEDYPPVLDRLVDLAQPDSLSPLRLGGTQRDPGDKE